MLEGEVPNGKGLKFGISGLDPNFVIQLETYDPEKVYDRIGLEEETTNILGMKVPAATIPVQTGRNLAVIIEVATMNYRQRAMGNNSAKELMEQLGLTDDVQP